jgi:hypothetical protein
MSIHFPFFIALCTLEDAEPEVEALEMAEPPVLAITIAVFALLASFAAAFFILVIDPAPPADTILSAIVGVIKTPIPVTTYATQVKSWL